MGFFRNIYYFFEDKWYDALDRVNKLIPIYKIVDPIDKVVPSFILFLLSMFFMIVLLGYLIQFSSAYEIKVTAIDASLNTPISGVKISGVIGLDEDAFEEHTDEIGETILYFSAPSKNTYEIISQLLFSSQESIPITISAEKQGYNSIKNQERQLDGREIDLNLTRALILEPPKYKDSETVLLVDSLTNQPIIDSTNSAYIKFKCNNKNTLTRTVYDEDDDSTKDGEFVLNEQKCEFVIIEAYAPEYETDSVSKRIPINNTGKFKVALTKPISDNPNGTAKIIVSELDGVAKKGVGGIRVLLTGPTTTTPIITSANGIAQENILPGNYNITINDANFYEIKPSDNINLTVRKGDTNTIEITIQRIRPEDARMIFIKVLDATDNNAIMGARVELVKLTIDHNNNYTGIMPNGAASFDDGPNKYTDLNGLFKRAGFSVKSAGYIVAVVHKAGYLYQVFKPDLLLPGNTPPQTITLTKATEENSGSAKIIVKSTEPVRPLARAKAFLHYDLVADGKTITGIQLTRDGNFTNAAGTAYYYELKAGTDQNYSATASFENNISKRTLAQTLDANAQLTFNVSLDINSRFLQLTFTDALTGETITSIPSTANVSVFTSSDTDFNNLTYMEKITPSAGVFKSAGYESTQRIKVKIKIPGYVENSLEVDGVQSPLAIGANIYKIKLYPDSMATEKVNIFFDDIYSENDNVWKGNSSATILQQASTYYAKFDVLAGKDINYLDLLSLSRMAGPANLTGILYSRAYRESADLFTCDTNNLDLTSPHDKNYYFPNCTNPNGANKQSGLEWKGNYLPKGTYSFTIKFTISSVAQNSEKIKLSYRAKSIDTNGGFETQLQSIEFDLNQPLKAGVYFNAKLNNTPVPLKVYTLDSNAFINSNNTSVFAFLQNPAKVTIYNKTPKPFTNGTIEVYTFDGASNMSNLASLLATTGSGNLKIKLSDGNEVNKQTFSNVSINSFSSQEIAFTLIPKSYNSRNWVIVVATFASTQYKVLIDASTGGRDLLVDAEFLAGVENQIFDGRVFEKGNTSTQISLNRVDIEVYKNCGTANETHISLLDNVDINGDYFSVRIPGVYRARIDCLVLTALASSTDYSFSPLIRTIYANYAGTVDPSLACVDVTLENATSETKDVYLDWNKNAKIIVRNNCNRPIKIFLDSGIMCKALDNSLCTSEKSISAGGSTQYILSGVNTSFAPSTVKPNYTDILGDFPIYIKAKYSDAQLSKKYVIAQSIDVHLTNTKQCFAISKDLFDFTLTPGKIDFNISNDCQYTLFGDYYIPRATLDAFGYDVNYPTTRVNSAVTFNPRLIISGNSFETIYTPVTVDSSWSSRVAIIDPAKSISKPNNLKLYYGLHVDLNDVPGTINKLQFRWFDKNKLKEGDPTPFGAAIDGSIKITYRDGNTQYFTPRTNFEFNPGIKCKSISPLPGETCEISEETDPAYAAGRLAVFGLFYMIPPTTKQIQYIDFNILGDMNSTNLEITIWPDITYIENVPSVVSSGVTTETQIDLGAFVIYPMEGVTYLLKEVKDTNEFMGAAFTAIPNPTAYLTSSRSDVNVWIEANYLKAKYVGVDVPQFNDKIIDLSLVQIDGKGINYGNINIVDYVSTQVGGKEISGAN